MPNSDRSSVEVARGVKLSVISAGAGRPLVILPGLSSSVAKFSYQIDEFSKTWRVIAIDPRGHGESDKPDWGYSYATLAKDLAEALNVLEISDVTLLGHSAGCKIILTYFELFGTAKTRSVIFSDDAPCCIDDGAFTLDEAMASVRALQGPEAEAFSRGFGAQFLTKDADQATREFFAAEQLKLPRAYHAKLLRWALFGDWWDAVDLVDVPALVIGGRASKNPWQNAVRLHERIRGSDLVIFEENEGGSHAMYWENPAKYNAAVMAFLDKH